MKGSVRYKILLSKNLTSLFSLLNLGFIQGSNALIQLLMVYVVTRVVGLDEFGRISVGTTYAMLVAMLVNYGSNQSGVKDVALYQQDRRRLAELFYSIYATRILVFGVASLVMVVVNFYFPLDYSRYFMLAGMLIVSEMLNPFFFFVGIQKLTLYNVMNLVGRLLSMGIIIVFVQTKADGPWVNFYFGLGNTLTYGILLFYIIKKYRLAPQINRASLKQFLTTNFYLTGNNIAVQLQQSYFVLAISTTDNAMALGAYTLCDKLLMGFRMLIIAFSNAVYPRAVLSFREHRDKWGYYKKKINLLLFGVFTATAVALLFAAPLITKILLNEENALSDHYIRCISFVPLVAALNAMNVIDLLMKDKYRYIFTIALLLLAATITSSTLFICNGNDWLYGYYPVTVEVLSLPLYWYFIKKSGNGPAKIQG